MADSFNTLSPDQVVDILMAGIRRQMDALMAKGYSREDAARIVTRALNGMAWNMGTAPSPLGG
jgi:hypothetical protein